MIVNKMLFIEKPIKFETIYIVSPWEIALIVKHTKPNQTIKTNDNSGKLGLVPFSTPSIVGKVDAWINTTPNQPTISIKFFIRFPLIFLFIDTILRECSKKVNNYFSLKK